MEEGEKQELKPETEAEKFNSMPQKRQKGNMLLWICNLRMAFYPLRLNWYLTEVGTCMLCCSKEVAHGNQ